MASNYASSLKTTLVVPTQGNLANRRLTARPLPHLLLPTNANATVSSPPELITPAITHFPPVCPPAPAPPTVQHHARQALHHPLPTIILPDLEPESDPHPHQRHSNMKAQPTTTRGGAITRANTVYPAPNKRTASYNNVSSNNHTNAIHRISNQSQLSPKSIALAAVQKRRAGVSSPNRPPMPYRTASATYSHRRSTPPPHQQQEPTVPSQLAQLAHRRALLAQRQALYAKRSEYRWAHVSTLDRGIRLLLEEEYREDVKAWMLEKEKQTLASATAMDQQPELQWHMRSHLLDFIIEIHLHFRLRPETLYLTLSILDRYVSRRVVYKKHYQLVGCVSLWLAAKFEDAKERVPSVRDLKELCHGQYDEGSFAQMEGHVLGTVDWDLGHPTPESWLRVLCTETHVGPAVQTGFGMFGAEGALGLVESPFEDMRTQHVARFLMELTLYGRDFLQFVPSMIALAALCLAREICGKPRRIADESADCLRLIALLDHTLSQALDSVSQTLVKKYSYAYYSKASGIVVTYYLRGNRYPLHTANVATAVETPETLATYEVPVEQLRASYLASKPQVMPMTPVRGERTDARMCWTGRTDVEETPGLVRSDSCSSGMDVDVDGERVGAREEGVECDGRSVRSFSEPREFDAMDDDEEDEDESVHHHSDAVDEDDEFFEMNPATNGTNGGGDYFHARHHMSDDASSSSGSQGSRLTVPSSDEVDVVGPITPTTPMFQLDPFGTAQTQPQQQQHLVVPVVVSSKDKENVGPGGYVPHHQGHHHHPCESVRVEDGEEAVGAEYGRHALLAIVPA
ncbi:hypothetical protein FRB97_001950 [Tulasnella sp. 331]|nr:hypothetical protein FRB97_001950 [Tulasnella sp. 331]KAG8888028.1 hypothetical protein FRB98_008562 [Tulasnella sp. 332]